MLPADVVLKKSWPEGSQATQFLTITCGWPISEQGEWLGAARASRVLTFPWASEHSFHFPGLSGSVPEGTKPPCSCGTLLHTWVTGVLVGPRVSAFLGFIKSSEARQNDSAGKDTCRVALVTKFEPQNPRYVRRTDSTKLFSDLYMCALAHVFPPY